MKIKSDGQGGSCDYYKVELTPDELALDDNAIIDICDNHRFNYGGNVLRYADGVNARVTVYRD